MNQPEMNRPNRYVPDNSDRNHGERQSLFLWGLWNTKIHTWRYWLLSDHYKDIAYLNSPGKRNGFLTISKHLDKALTESQLLGFVTNTFPFFCFNCFELRFCHLQPNSFHSCNFLESFGLARRYGYMLSFCFSSFPFL